MREGFRAGEVSSSKGKILVVDDNDSILHLITDFISNLKGHTVYSASNAARALELVNQHSSELALLDIMMPEGHGVELLRRIKKVSPEMRPS